ncbi:hypothetical protein DIPPA_06344 [Diplonema papillatum]|nr:hypothetical protein DIPPA_29085 [Diplonema papillatum]KAJ9448647.1 hypothetical protein DIPPA_29094 [Diplonema papillatum]KAJ9448703.1 hypothetical protein DIPPA_06344 [Diplonema papillatum]
MPDSQQSPLPNAEKWEYRFPAALKDAWTRTFLDAPPAKRKFRVKDMERFCGAVFGSCSEAVKEKVLSVLVEAIGAEAANVAGFDLPRGLAVLMMANEEDEERVKLACQKVLGKAGAVPPPSLAAAPAGVTMEQLTDMYAQALGCIEEQKREMQGLKTKMLAMEAERGRPAAAAVAIEPEVPVAFRYVEEETEVVNWAEQMALDPEGLVQALRIRYVSGLQDRAGSDALEDSFTRLRGWIGGVGSGSSGWTTNRELVRLGNELLTDVRLHHLWCRKKLPRGQILREVAQSHGDAIERAAAKVEDRLASRSRGGKWDATPRGGKGGKRPFWSGNGRPGGK